MRHVAFVPFTGFRILSDELRELGLKLPGLRQRAEALAELPALGLLTLAGLAPPDWTCSYHPARTADDALLAAVLQTHPDLVAVSALTASVAEAYRLCDRLRTAGVPTAIGGLHATVCPEEAAAHADAVVVGEGEPVWADLLADASAGRLIREYRASSRIARTAWPVPRFDLLGPQPPRYTLQTQRGCPLACDFCAASRLLGRFREKPVEAVRDELRVICGITSAPLLELADDNTFAGDRDPDELLQALSDADARWFTECDWRIGERPDLPRRMAAAGCVQVLIGIESLVFRYPGMGDKQAELTRMLHAVDAVQAAGVAVNACFIIGADGETRPSLERLVAFLHKRDFADVQVTLQTPFPGTMLRRRLVGQGRLLAHRGWSAYTLFDVTYQPDHITVADLEAGFRDVLEAVFDQGEARRRMEIRRSVWRGNPRLRRWSTAVTEAELHD